MPASASPSLVPAPVRPHRVLSLDGGGAKGFYTLGVLKEIESRAGRRLGEHFDFIYGTSTGAMVAALLGLGRSVDEIMAFYRRNVPPLIHERTPWAKSALLKHVVDSAFGTLEFSAFRTRVGIISTHWTAERPLLLRGSTPPPAGSTLELRSPCTIAQAVEASCSAYPFFDRLELSTVDDGTLELADGSYSANNPVLFAIGAALAAAHGAREALRVISVGVGIYPRPSYHGLHGWLHGLKSARLIQKMLNVNTETMEQLRQFLYGDIPALRINRVFSEPEMAIDLMESNLPKLETLFQHGRESVIAQAGAVDALILDPHPASPASVPCP